MKTKFWLQETLNNIINELQGGNAKVFALLLACMYILFRERNVCPPLWNLSNKQLAYLCISVISPGSFCILEMKSQGSHTSKSFQQTPPKCTTAPKHIRMQRVHEIFPGTHTELNVNIWTIRDSTEIRWLFAIHLLLSFCIIFAHISMDCVYCLSVHQCDVLHYLCDTEVVHLKHQKNDKQPWFRGMHVKGRPSIQRGHFLCITISQGHYTGQGSIQEKSRVIGPATQDEMRARSSLVPCGALQALRAQSSILL